MKTILLWDLPTRIFHWALAACVAGAVATGLAGGNLMDWHGRFGIAVAALLAFRGVWGVAGATPSRFSALRPTPSALAASLRGQWHGVGHSPLGALSVLAMLAALAFQVGSGLVASDDIAFAGPYNALVGKSIEVRVTAWHKTTAWLVVALTLLHVGAIAFYRFVRGDNLVRPMLIGRRPVPPEIPDPRPGHPAALVAAVVLAALAGWAAAGGPLPYLLPPPPATGNPAW